MKDYQRSGSKYGLTLRIVERGSDRNKGSNGDETVAEIGTEIAFDPSILDTYHYEGWREIHHDLLVVCAAVEFADRRRARRATQWSRRIQVILPVFELAAWEQTDVQVYLHDTLRHLTGDDWQFSFVQARHTVENGGRQRMLPFRHNKEYAIAYSNGLDSRCVSGLFDVGDSIVRVRVAKMKDTVKDGERPFDQIPFSVRVAPSRESGVRSRGFKFAAITAIAGHLSRVGKIIVPESGQGALGPVLLPLHNTYPDYRNHPTFLRKMERFVRALLGYSVTYEQPRLWSTKGETVGDFLAKTGTSRESMLSTHSCWQQRWNVRFNGKLRQCGLCVACLLRRMSVRAAGVDEPADRYAIGDLTMERYEDAIPRHGGMRLSSTMVEYGSVGARHLQHLADIAERSDMEFRPYVFEIARATGLLEQDTVEVLKRLLLQHAAEWHEFVSALGGHSFIGNWTKGARYGRYERNQ